MPKDAFIELDQNFVWANAEREDIFLCVQLEVQTQTDLLINLVLWGSIDLNYYWLIRKLLIT